MTWYLDPSTGDVYDHTGSVVTTLSEPYQVPDDVLAVIGDELDALVWDLSQTYVQNAMRDALTERIEAGTP